MNMPLDTPDLCARLDRLKNLCDRLEGAQYSKAEYRRLVIAIRAEADAFQEIVCLTLKPEQTPRRKTKID